MGDRFQINNFDTPLGQIPTYSELIGAIVGAHMPGIETRSGTSNEVNTYTFSDGSKKAVRR